MVVASSPDKAHYRHLLSGDCCDGPRFAYTVSTCDVSAEYQSALRQEALRGLLSRPGTA